MLIQILSCAVLSIALTELGARWIDRLYAREDAPLNFPDQSSARSRLRRPLLALGHFVCLLSIVDRTTPEIFFLSTASFVLLLITATDFEQYVIFDRMTLTLAIVGLLATIFFEAPIEEHLLAATLGGGVFTLIAFVTRGALGGGDIKLIAALGLWLGIRLLDVIMYGSIAGGLAALIMLATKNADRRTLFAYGPYFALTALFIMLSS